MKDTTNSNTKTAGEFMKEISPTNDGIRTHLDKAGFLNKVQMYMTRYADERVQAAIPVILQEAADKAKIKYDFSRNADRGDAKVDKDSILQLQDSDELKLKLGLI